MAHKDICIRFTVMGRSYEIVGFMDEGEDYLRCPDKDYPHYFEEIMRRVPGAIGKEDVGFLEQNLHYVEGSKLEKEFKRVWGYFWTLALRDKRFLTGYTGGEGCGPTVLFFWVWGGNYWKAEWNWMGGISGSPNNLVIRRR